MNEGIFDPQADQRPINERKWEVSDYGIVGHENAVWTFCEQIPERDTIRLGENKYLQFRTGMGKSTLKVTRVH